MLNALFGVRRVLRRVPRTSTRRPADPVQAPTPLTDRARDGLRAAAIAAHLLPSHATRKALASALAPVDAVPAVRRGMLARLGHQRACALVVAGVVLGATGVSSLPAPAATASTVDNAQALTLPLTGSVGGPLGDAAPPRIVAGGASRSAPAGIDNGARGTSLAPNAFRDITRDDVEEHESAAITGPFLDDGTLLKPVSVTTTVADARDMIRTYKVKAGDTLAEIGRRHKVSANSIYWANKLKTTKLKAGWRLTIPPVSGLLVTVTPSDTLESLAKKHKIKADAILKANELDDPNLVMGQLLVMPGAKGGPMVRPPKPKKVVVPNAPSTGGAVAGGGPARYSGGSFVWPTGGGSVSRGYGGGHFGLDIAADTGTVVRAAAGGKVLFAGWKSNGGGYQVWISHGSGLYTTYNHMSSVSVGTGQAVGRGQRVGGVGSTGNSTGPHLHFEVWKGQIWNGGSRLNAMAYL